MSGSMVTIVVVPRDHFSDARESLDSIIEHTDIPYSLVYVDAGTPRAVATHIERLSVTHGFRLIRTEHYLLPNHARNIGGKELDSRYIVFIDNDVIVAPGWLEPLVACAESTGAAVVGPLNYEGRPLHTIVHFAGGEAHIDTTDVTGRTERRLVDKIYKKNVPKEHVVTEVAEFHCMLVRTETLREVGGLDEEMLSTRENIDFCMEVRDRGYEVYLVPDSQITYLAPLRMKLSDVPYFSLRWSDAFDLSSLHHLRDKWKLTEDEYFARQYRNLGWRRRGLMLQGKLLGRVPSWKLRLAVARLVWPLERRLNRRISSRYARQYLRTQAYKGLTANISADRLPSSDAPGLTE